MSASSVPLAPPLAALHRKASVDAGFDLEPERDGAWWRLRAGGAPGVVWVHPLPAAGAPLGTAAPGAPTALLALPTPAQLAALDAPTTGPGVPPGPGLPAPPPGAAGCAACPSPERLYAWLRRTWLARAASPERLQARWEGEAAAQLAAAGLPTGRASGHPRTTRRRAPVGTTLDRASVAPSTRARQSA